MKHWSPGRVPKLVPVCVILTASSTASQLQWSSKDEEISVKLGLLAQLQAESSDVPATDEETKNLFIRRLRLMLGFKLNGALDVFVQTDSPNIGKGNIDGTKNAGDLFIQDFVATWKFTPEIELDAGLLVTAQTYNHNQSATSLAALDYGPFSFVESEPIGARTGRDYGVRVRGYLAENRVEYRAGVYQGQRGVNASNEFRYVGRLMFQFFSPQRGLFYRGTSLGKTQTLSFGASFDGQEDYKSFGGDVYYEHPFENGDSLVLQGDIAEIDGDTFLPTLPERTNYLLEGAYYFAESKLQPFVQYASQDLDQTTLVDEDRYTLGLAYFHSGHNNNLKLAYTHIDRNPGESDDDQVLLQWQIFQF